MLKLVRFYGYRGLRIVKGSMQYVWDDTGRRFIDCHAGHGAAFLGHSNPTIVEAVASQARELIAASSSFSTPSLEEALAEFSRVAPPWAEEIVFLNTGSEAVEAALKAAWLATGRRGVVALKNSFHGRTLASLSVTWNPRYRSGAPVLDATFISPTIDPGDVDKRVPRDTAAIIIEPIQGEGGLTRVSPELAKALKEAADRVGALLIFDEIQTGFGRTGRTWAHLELGVEPDIMTAGKSIAGGLPASAVVSRDGVLKSLAGGRHGSTHAANPLSMAAVAAASRLLRGEGVPDKARRAGALLAQLLQERLGGLRPVRDIRGEGLMLGVELRFDPGPVLRCLQESQSVLALKAGATVVRLLPPYAISRRDVEMVAYGLEQCICREAGC
ncbi:aspartate aminotransferase family protein [Aeropyrum camini]|uniref:Putative [LysW]-aminoadipate semialdehyde/glutamate semialdehyde transaminase n=1 Tax=Aeropyrum camini SY1 = JCM 12091 TaxID=1198449 RepID=U3TEK3_9CREN|nr:aspartate aminotransferase family protein [Aeropyrum camini]BAN90393.1 acetyl-lysine aminotransferase/acetylornithine [Aeropyrum camini SY1 = JCM 12091]